MHISRYLFNRECGLDRSSYSYSTNKCQIPGYDIDSILMMQRFKTPEPIAHDGCVNTVVWTACGRKLLTGSDDRTVKFWNMLDFDNPVLLHTVETGHTNNIFCIGTCRMNPNILVSGAADGTVRLNDLHIASQGNTSAGERILHNAGVGSFVHRTLFDVRSPSVLYIADDRGHISRVDVRTKDASECIFVKYDDYSSSRRRQVSAKAIAQHENDENILLVGGSGFVINIVDKRMTDCSYDASLAYYNPTITNNKDIPPAVDICRGLSYVDVSISGLQISKDGKTVLANYHKDQIYLFPGIHSSSITLHPSGAFEAIAARACLGGHINDRTFLKEVNFFGPHDEYVVAGDDAGLMWIWDAESGVFGPDHRRHFDFNEETKPYDFPMDISGGRPCRPLNIFPADRDVCNGVVPHPYLPILASYGIDSTVKIWGTPYSLNMNRYKSKAELVSSALESATVFDHHERPSLVDFEYLKNVILEEIQFVLAMNLDAVTFLDEYIFICVTNRMKFRRPSVKAGRIRIFLTNERLGIVMLQTRMNSL